MSEEKDPMVSGLEVHEEFMQHIETGVSKIGKSAVLMIIAAGLLSLSYLSQLVVLPFMLGVTSQTVNLLDPTLVAFEVGLLAVTLLWLYLGLRDYFFVRRLGTQIRNIRKAEAELMKKHGLDA